MITAAHCYVSGVNYSFHCGGLKHEGHDETHTYTADSFVAHGDYIEDTSVDDIAVITLNEESDIELPIVSRDIHEIQQDGNACAMGWGYTTMPYGYPSKVLKIARDLEQTAVDCPFDISVICADSTTGKTAYGDSGGPVIMEKDTAEKDVLFGLTSGGNMPEYTTLWFTNLPYFLESFVSEKVRAAENTIEANLPDPECPANPTEDPSDSIQIEIVDASITFTCADNTPNEEASVEWSEITRDGAEVRFDINIEKFTPSTTGTAGFKLTVYEHATLHIGGDGQSAEWISEGVTIAKSFILPGSGSHKARIEHTATGFIIYEDGMKSGIYDLASPSANVATKFSTMAEDAAMSFTVSITNVRMDPVPSGTSTGDDSDDGDSDEEGSDGGDTHFASRVVV